MLDDTVSQIARTMSLMIELAGIGIIGLGVAAVLLRYGWQLVSGRAPSDATNSLRSSLGKAVLLGLELLVAADIIYTVAVELTLRSVAVLAGIVAIRTFLSFSLEAEIEGRWPWQAAAQAAKSKEAAADANTTAAQASPKP